LPHPWGRYGLDLTGGEGVLSSFRLARVEMTLHIIKDHPWIGLGLQHFRARFYDYFPAKCYVPYEFMVADNMYLTILSEAGLLGFSGILLLIIAFFRKAYKQIKVLQNSPKIKMQVSISLLAFTGLLVSMSGYELFYWQSPYMFFCVIIGILGIDSGKIIS